MLSTERASGHVLLPDPLYRRPPWLQAPLSNAAQAGEKATLLNAQHQCCNTFAIHVQASQTLLCGTVLHKPVKAKKSLPRILLTSGICPATPCCSEPAGSSISRTALEPGSPNAKCRSKISAAFQLWRCWDPLVHSVTLGGLRGQVSLGLESPPCTNGAERGSSSLFC